MKIIHTTFMCQTHNMWFQLATLLFIGSVHQTLAQTPANCLTIKTQGGSQQPEHCKIPFIHKKKIYFACTIEHDPGKKAWCSVHIDSKRNHITGKGGWGHCGPNCEVSEGFVFQAKPGTVTNQSTLKQQPTTPRTSNIRPSVTSLVRRPATSTRPVTTRGTSQSSTKSRTHTSTTAGLVTTSPNQQTTPRSVTDVSKVINNLKCVTVSGKRANKICVIPYNYLNKTNTECTLDGADDGRAWCSTQVDINREHIKGSWGHCECTTKDGCQTHTFEALSLNNQEGTLLPLQDDSNFRCGIARLQKLKTSFIIGGKSTDLQEFPFAVLLVYFANQVDKSGKSLYLCGGTLINRRYVLTAAHCVNEFGPRQVRIGEFDLDKDCDCLDGLCAPLPQVIGIEKAIVHNGYSPHNSYVNDITLLRLNRPAILNIGSGVVCLPLPQSSFFTNLGATVLTGTSLREKNATVVGWGRTSPFNSGTIRVNGAPTATIQKVEVPIVDDVECRKRWSGGVPMEGQFCAGIDGFDSCKGDSGGPLLIRSGVGNPWYLIGIVSFGASDCGNGKPAIYTRVEHYLDWIKENVEE